MPISDKNGSGAMPDSVNYVLQDSFKYGSTSSGSMHDASFIELRAPSSKNSRECAALKQAFFRAAAGADEAAEQQVATEEEEGDSQQKRDSVTPEAIIATLAMASGIDLADVFDVAKHLFTRGGVALVDGDMRLTSPLMDLMSQRDLEAMTGTYLLRFILASSRQQMKTGS